MKLRPIHAVYAILTVGVLVSLASVFNVVSLWRSTANQASAQFRDSILWYATGYNAELNMLINAVRDRQSGEAGSTEDLADRFDVFWSRLESAGNGTLGRRFARLETARETVSDALLVMREFEPVVLDEGTPDAEQLARFLASLREFQPRFRRLSLAALSVRNADSVELFELQRNTTSQILLLLGVVIALGMSLVVMLRRDKAAEARLRRRLEEHVAERTRELEQSERRYRTLVEHAPEAIVVLDANLGRFVDLNRNATELFGMGRSELLEIGPESISPRLQPDGRDSASAAREHVRHAVDGESTLFEWVHCDVRGTEIPCEVRLVKLPSISSVLIRGSITDISTRKEKDRELARYRENLEDLIQERTQELESAQLDLVRSERLAAIGQLTGTVGHELRNPLATISMSCRLLRDQLADAPPQARTILDRVEHNISRCDGIINDLLDHTRTHELRLQSADIDTWLNTVLDEVSVPAPVVVLRTLESCATVHVDPARLRQVIVNLVQNASQALLVDESPTTRPEIRVSSAVIDGRVRIQVADNGPGVAPEHRETIFEPLFSTRAFGVGLGLPLVREIIERHGGEVVLEPGDGGDGAVFSLWLPLRSPRSDSV